MRQTRVRPLAAVRSLNRIRPEHGRSDDAQRFRQTLSGNRRLALRTSIARLGGVLRSPDREEPYRRTLPGGRQRASGTGGPNGGNFGLTGGSASPLGHAFDAEIPPNGYAWWYLDALSDDGQQAITIIAMLGNVFSPYYAFARRHRPCDPLNHCAMNVVLYGSRGKRWAMTERPKKDVQRTPTQLIIGPSSASWDGKSLTFAIEEVCVPIPTRLKGRVRVLPSATADVATQLHPSGLHFWLPIAPAARVEVEFERPDNSWTGNGYLDCNFGQQPLEDAFERWNWARGQTTSGTVVVYNVETRDGNRVSFARLYDQSVQAKDLPLNVEANLSSTLWHISRRANCDPGTNPRLVKTLEDTPFYARSIIETIIVGAPIMMVHESLSLRRFANPIVRAMLPFRMPRRRYSMQPAAVDHRSGQISSNTKV
jgi:carotenoid 1,2-hydratase